jgi:hypothetical protein
MLSTTSLSALAIISGSAAVPCSHTGELSCTVSSAGVSAMTSLGCAGRSFAGGGGAAASGVSAGGGGGVDSEVSGGDDSGASG